MPRTTSQRPAFSSLLLLTVLACWPAAVHADSQRVAVLAFTGNVSSQVSFEMTERVRDEVSSIEGHELSAARASIEQLSMAQDCDPDSSECLAQIASGLNVDALVLGKLTQQPAAVTGEIILFDVAQAGVVRAADVSFPTATPGAVAIREHARSVVDVLFERSSGLEPSVAAPGAPAGRKPTALSPSGLENAAAIEQAEDPRVSGGVSTREIVGYTLLGVAAVSAGLSVLSFVQLDRAQGDAAFSDYRRAVGAENPGVKDVCAEADAGKRYGLSDQSFRDVRDGCGMGQTYEVLQFVFIGTALAAGGTAAYLLLTGDDDAASDRAASTGLGAIALSPILGLRSAGLKARMRF